MGMIYIMLVVSLVIALFFLASFFWATKSGQFDDDYTPSVRILFDDESTQNSNNQAENKQIDGNSEV
jgi:cbb3-type cytochrome oxidase maturation protein